MRTDPRVSLLYPLFSPLPSICSESFSTAWEIQRPGSRASRQRVQRMQHARATDRGGRAAILHNLLAIIGSAHIADRVAFASRDLSMGWLAINDKRRRSTPRSYAALFRLVYIVLPKLRAIRHQAPSQALVRFQSDFDLSHPPLSLSLSLPRSFAQ
jgi:hypothetical protein